VPTTEGLKTNFCIRQDNLLQPEDSRQQLHNRGLGLYVCYQSHHALCMYICRKQNQVVQSEGAIAVHPLNTPLREFGAKGPAVEMLKGSSPTAKSTVKIGRSTVGPRLAYESAVKRQLWPNCLENGKDSCCGILMNSRSGAECRPLNQKVDSIDRVEHVGTSDL